MSSVFIELLESLSDLYWTSDCFYWLIKNIIIDCFISLLTDAKKMIWILIQTNLRTDCNYLHGCHESFFQLRWSASHKLLNLRLLSPSNKASGKRYLLFAGLFLQYKQILWDGIKKIDFNSVRTSLVELEIDFGL